MPACKDCRKLANGQCQAYEQAQTVLKRTEALQPPPLGACMLPIVEDYLAYIKPGMRVLDVGCGTWDWIKQHCASVGAHYEGIDVRTEYFGIKTIATRLENLAALSYPDDDFDIVI